MASKRNPQITIKQQLHDEALEIADKVGLSSVADVLSQMFVLYKADFLQRLTGNYTELHGATQQSTTGDSNLQQSTAGATSSVDMQAIEDTPNWAALIEES